MLVETKLGPYPGSLAAWQAGVRWWVFGFRVAFSLLLSVSLAGVAAWGQRFGPSGLVRALGRTDGPLVGLLPYRLPNHKDFFHFYI